MRNNTKLKLLLQKYTVTFEREDDGLFVLLLTDKDSGQMKEFEGKSYSDVLGKAYSYLLRVLKSHEEE